MRREKAQIQALTPFTTGQSYQTQQIGSRYPENYNQPNETWKLQYSNNLNASTFLTAKIYEVNNVANFDFPFITNAFDGADYSSLQGGYARGVTLDLTKQLNSKNLLAIGGNFSFLHPVFAQASGTVYALVGAVRKIDGLRYWPSRSPGLPIAARKTLVRT